mgnify:CR=1 FL=1
MLRFFSGIVSVLCIYLITMMYYEKQELLVPEQCLSENSKNNLFNNFEQNGTFQHLIKTGVNISSIDKISEISFDKEKHIRLCQAQVNLTNGVTISIKYTIEKRIRDILTPIYLEDYSFSTQKL